MNGELIQLRQNEIYEYIKGRNLTTIQDISEALHVPVHSAARPQEAGGGAESGLLPRRRFRAYRRRTLYGTEGAPCPGKRDGRAAGGTSGGIRRYHLHRGGSSTYAFASALSCRTNLENVAVVTAAMNIANCFMGNAGFPGDRTGRDREDLRREHDLADDARQPFRF